MRLLRAPRAVGRFIRGFVHPQRTAGRVPLGRLAIAVQIVAALAFVGYTLQKKAIRLPFASEAYQVQVVFPDGKGLDRFDEPGAAVAGTPLGRVTEVHYEQGRAVATLTLEPEVRGKVFADATATIRPGSAIQNLVVNVSPGTPEAGPLPDGQPIPQEHTSAFVAVDDLTGILDADTRAYTQILVSEAERVLRGREGELREGLRELGELSTNAAPVSRALATRRRLLARLVGDLDRIFAVLGRRGDQLAEAINAGTHTLRTTAAREAELVALTRELAPTLVEAQGALAAVNRLTVPLLPALEQLVPATPSLSAGIGATRDLLPRASKLVDTFDSLADEGEEPLALMIEGTRGISARIERQVPIAEELSALARRMDQYKRGMAQTADTLSGALSVNDNGGTYAQVDALRFEEPKPENLGFSSRAAAGAGARARIEGRLGEALVRACVEGSDYACLVRMQLPALLGNAVGPSAAGAGGFPYPGSGW